MHSLGDVWHPGSADPPWNAPDPSAVLLERLRGSLSHYSPLSKCMPWVTFGIRALRTRPEMLLTLLQSFGSGCAAPCLTILHYLNAFLGWRLASGLCGPALKCSWPFCSPFGAACAAPCLTILHYLNAFLGWRLASGLCGPALKCSWPFCSPFGAAARLPVSLFSTILMHSLGDVWHPGSADPLWNAPDPSAVLLERLRGSLSHYYPLSYILMHSLGDVWHPGSADPPWNAPDPSAVLLERLRGSLSHYSPLS